MSKELDKKELQSSIIYKRCFFSLCIALLVDLILKLTFWYYYSPKPIVDKDGVYISGPKPLPFYAIWGIQMLALLSIFLYSIFALAKKGILPFSKLQQDKKSPFGRYAIISLIISNAVFVVFLLSRVVMMLPFSSLSSEYGAWGFLIFLVAYLLITVPFFVFLLLMFFLAYKVAKKQSK